MDHITNCKLLTSALMSFILLWLQVLTIYYNTLYGLKYITVLFQITNRGPSDWNNLTVNIWLPEKVSVFGHT